MQVINPKHQRIIFGILLAGLWLSGLFLVLEMESLVLKAVVLLALAPLSLELDRLVSRLVRRPAYQPVAQPVLDARNQYESVRRSTGEIAAAKLSCANERLAA